jgi:hypothetical protein
VRLPEEQGGASSAAPQTELPGVSVVLPVLGEDHALKLITKSYVEVLEQVGCAWEIILVRTPYTPIEHSIAQIGSSRGSIKIVTASDGWGAAVRVGLRASTHGILSYASYARTSAAVLAEMLSFAQRNPELVLRANRRTRDTRIQRLGSLLFNIECRALLGVPAWDVNGTPKVFPRTFDRLLELTRDDDLIDAEFSLICERAGYPVIEIPVDAPLLSGLVSRRDYRGAMRMYLGVLVYAARGAGRRSIRA